MTRAGRPLMIMAVGAAVCISTIQQAQAHPKDPHPARASVATARHVVPATHGATSHSGRSARTGSAEDSDRVAASEWRFPMHHLTVSRTPKAGEHRGPVTTQVTTAPTNKGKAKGIAKGTGKGHTVNGTKGSTGGGGGTPTPGVVTTGNGNAANAANAAKQSQGQAVGIALMPAGSLAAFPALPQSFPPPPAPPGSGQSPQSTSESPGGAAPPGSARPSPGTSAGNRTPNPSVPYQATNSQPRPDSLALLLLIGLFGLATTGMVVAAGHRGRRNTG